MLFRIAADRNLERRDPPRPCRKLGRIGVAARVSAIRLAGAARRISAQRHDVLDAARPVAAQHLVHLLARRGDAGQVRSDAERSFAKDPRNGLVGALARGASGAVGHRHEVRIERGQLLHRRPQFLVHRLGLGRKNSKETWRSDMYS